MMFHASNGKGTAGASRGTALKEKLLNRILPAALGVVIVTGAAVWTGLPAQPGEVPAPEVRTDAPAAEPAAIPHPAAIPDAQPAESSAAKAQKPETSAIAAVESAEISEEILEEAAEDPPAPAPKPRIVYSQEALDEKIEAIVSSIITEGMSRREQAYAVFCYVNSHVRYVGTSNKNSWQEGAFEGLTTGRGDCYTYFALSRALLSALNIDNLEVRRVGGTTSHYWNLVNCGDGWYHFDAGPHVIPMPDGSSFFMFTDEEAAAYTEAAGRNYYDFDSSLYPARGYAEPAPEPEAPAEPELPGEEQLPEETAFGDTEIVPEDPEAVPGDAEIVPEDPEAVPGDTETEETVLPEEQVPAEAPWEEPSDEELPAGEAEFPVEPEPAPEEGLEEGLMGEAEAPAENSAEDEPPVIVQAPPVSV